MHQLDFYKKISLGFKRSDFQINKTNESDSELIQVPDFPNTLAFTIDNIVEEIEFGIYEDPYLIGWMSIIVNITDLLAVGSKPLFALLSETFPLNCNEEYINLIQKGIRDASEYCNISIIGGDTNFSEKPSFGATAIGVIDISKKYCQRIGCNNGDIVFSSGWLGGGNYHGLLTMMDKSQKSSFFPRPKIEYHKLISEYATSCIDTSDGLISSLNTIKTVNDCGINIYEDILSKTLSKEMINYCKSLNINPWILLAGILGEYELLYTVSPKNLEPLVDELKSQSLPVIILGEITNQNDVKISVNGVNTFLDVEAICDLNQNLDKNNLSYYISQLSEILNS